MRLSIVFLPLMYAGVEIYSGSLFACGCSDAYTLLSSFDSGVDVCSCDISALMSPFAFVMVSGAEVYGDRVLAGLHMASCSCLAFVL